MPSVSKDSAAQHADHGPVEEWTEAVNGYTINFVRFAVDIDSTPLLTRLAGDAFYVEGGHLPVRRRGKRVVQFSPAEELRAVSETIAKNMQQLQGA